MAQGATLLGQSTLFAIIYFYTQPAFIKKRTYADLCRQYQTNVHGYPALMHKTKIGKYSLSEVRRNFNAWVK